MSFTPGPWEIRGKKTIRASNGIYVATLSHWNAEANARLIAAAPEMHDALEGADVDLDLLLMAIKAGDPPRELEIRASDIKRRLSAALSRVKG